MEEFGFVHRAICLESNEGTVATECKVDFMEIVDRNDESIITSSYESEITSSTTKVVGMILSRYV